jgi:pimeloyl-ACP methyl ester carboxylesterase
MNAPTTPRPPRTFDLGFGMTVTVSGQGDIPDVGGSGVLLLHGGAGPRSMAGLAAALSEHAYVITPTHPGFDGTPRPDWADRVDDLALSYLDLLDTLTLRQVLVIGSSFGGWIAAEMALRDNGGKISGLVMANGVGIQPTPPAEIADVAKIGPAELSRRAFHNPALRVDPATLPEAAQAAMAANGRAAAVYTAPHMYDPKLHRRLHRVSVPVLFVWGEEDGVVPIEYGRAFADSFPHATFRSIPEAGHFPHIEQPALTMAAISDFVAAEIKPDGA